MSWVHSFSLKNFLEHHGTLAYRPWCFSVPIAYGFHSEAHKATSSEWVRSIGAFLIPYPTPCDAVWILCSRAKSPMKNCNRRVNYSRLLTPKLNFMNTHAAKICICQIRCVTLSFEYTEIRGPGALALRWPQMHSTNNFMFNTYRAEIRLSV